MNTLLLQDLVASRDAVREAWLSALPADARQAARVDAALDELIAHLRHEVHEGGPAAAGRRGRGPCPEKALTQFYLAGEQALLAVAWILERTDPAAALAEQGVELTELYSQLRQMARRDISQLCRRCPHCLKVGHAHPARDGLQPSPAGLASPA